MGAQSAFLSCLTILLIVNIAFSFAYPIAYTTLDFITALTTVLAVIVTVVLIGVVSSGSVRYVFGVAILLGTMFTISYTIYGYTITVGIGLLQRILTPFLFDQYGSFIIPSDILSWIGFMICSSLGFITLTSGLMITLGGGE